MTCNQGTCACGPRPCPLAVIAALVFLAALLGACGSRPADPISEPAPTAGAAAPVRLSPDEFLARVRPGDQVIDVRTPAEQAGGYLEDALLADVNASNFSQLVAPLDRDRPTYVYCRTGGRSERAAQIMRGMGFTHVVNVGGFERLARAGAPVEPAD